MYTVEFLSESTFGFTVGFVWLAQDATSHADPAGPLATGGPALSMHAPGYLQTHTLSELR